MGRRKAGAATKRRPRITLTHTAIDAALERGCIARQAEPRAASARFDHRRRRVIVERDDGCSFTFPPRLAAGLDRATDDQIAQVEILGAGYGLHWEALDLALSLPGLVAGLFGTRLHRTRRAAQAMAPAKAATARGGGRKRA